MIVLLWSIALCVFTVDVKGHRRHSHTVGGDSTIVFPTYASTNGDNFSFSTKNDHLWWNPAVNETSSAVLTTGYTQAMPIQMARMLDSMDGLKQLLINPERMEKDMQIMQRNAERSAKASSPMALRTRIASDLQTSYNENGVLARPAGCQPELVSIPLIDTLSAADIAPATTTAASATAGSASASGGAGLISVWPSCTRVHRCGGCCGASQLMQCQPNETRQIHVQVVKTLYSGNDSKVMEYLGTKMVTLVEHTSCKCDCKQDAKSCNALQRFSELDCACVCADQRAREQCARLPDRLWDAASCRCLCRQTFGCSSSHYFDYNQCKCRLAPVANSDITDAFFGRFAPLATGSGGDTNRPQLLGAVKEARHATPQDVMRRAVKVRGPQRSKRYNARDRRE